MVKGGSMENLTEDQIMAKAKKIQRDLLEKMRKFIEETGCAIRSIDIETTEKLLGQTGLAQLQQTIKVHVGIPEAIKEAAHAANH